MVTRKFYTPRYVSQGKGLRATAPLLPETSALPPAKTLGRGPLTWSPSKMFPFFSPSPGHCQTEKVRAHNQTGTNADPREGWSKSFFVLGSETQSKKAFSPGRSLHVSPVRRRGTARERGPSVCTSAVPKCTSVAHAFPHGHGLTITHNI